VTCCKNNGKTVIALSTIYKYCCLFTMMQYSLSDIQSWSRFYRANFINTLSGFKSASLIGTISNNGQYNLAIFSNIVHIGADPALIGFVNRPREAAPHTLANIETTGFYTINLIPITIVQQAHQTSAKFDAAVSEFDAVGLVPEILGDCKAPFVKQSPVKYAMELKEIIPITHNNTFFVIGAITAVFLEDNLVEEDGSIDLQKADIITSLGIDSYYSVNKEAKFNYAKP
jgi:flavin reductase (DIM6/NTAB) family NADH-FMN oxidoreductase RutF